MAPFPYDNSTWRVKIQYTSCLEPHEMLLRYNAGTTIEDITVHAQLVADEMRGVMDDSDAVTGATISEVGSNFSLPLEITVGAGALTGTTINTENKAIFAQFQARGTDGRRASFSMFTAAAADFTVYRTPVLSASTPWQDLYTALLAENGMSNISGAVLLWKNYINIGVSQYYQNRLR